MERRQFVIVGHDAPTTPDFSLDDLAGDAGRLDVLCRSLTSSLLYSHGIRESVRTHLVLGDELTISFVGESLRHLNPDERSTAARIKTALEHREDAIGSFPATPSPGVALYRRGFAATLDSLEDETTLVQLHESADPISVGSVPTNPVFVLSDHRDFTDEEQALLDDRCDQQIRLGPTRLHADQAITVAHHFLDTNGYTDI